MSEVRWMAARRASLAAAVVLAAVLLLVSFRGIAWRDVWATVRGANPWGLAAGSAAASLALLLRSLRWRVLLNAEGRIGVAPAFWATAAGLLANNLLPARAGEVVRSMMVSSGSGLSTALVLTTALGERVVDAIVLVTVSAVALLVVPVPPGWLASAARPFAIAGLVGAAAIALLPLLGSRIQNRTVQEILRGVRAFHGARRLGVFLALTAVVWLVDGAGAVVVGAAIGVKISLAIALLLIAALGLASALPSTPGYVGLYQFVAVSVLPPFGFSRTDAMAFILVAQALTYAVTALWGAIALWRYRSSGRLPRR